MKYTERKQSPLYVAFKVILFIVYLAVLTYFLFFAEGFGRQPAESASYNFVPFREILRTICKADILGAKYVAINLFGNIAAFMPFGFILPAIFRKKFSGAWSTIAAGAMFSIIIEAAQFVTHLGCCDVDDVILNTSGAALGWLIHYIYRLLKDKHET